MGKKVKAAAAVAFGVLALTALGVPGASAAETTAYTCVAGGTEFGNAHCSEVGSGWHHVSVPNGESTQLTFNALKSFKFGFEGFGAAIEMSGSTVECLGCHFENAGSIGAMKVLGSGGRLKFSGLTVTSQPTKCAVKSDPGGIAGVIETEPLKYESVATQEMEFEPATANGPIAHFEIVAIAPQKCNFAGTYTLNGTFSGILVGATLEVDVTEASHTLTANGDPAHLNGEVTLEGGLTGATHHAISFT